MMYQGVISRSNSKWVSPVVLAPKHDGTLRFCVDYRRLNAINVRDTYLIPRMDDCIDSLGDAKVFTTLDCNSSYWQIPVAKEDRPKTTFTCHEGTYQFKRMTFGLMNAPATFQRTLNSLLSRYHWKSCLVYLDDVIIFSDTPEAHIHEVERVLTTLNRAGLSLKLKKCHFLTDSVEYLGQVVRPGELRVHPRNIVALRDANHPRTQTQLRSFLGLCNVYRRFVANFAKIAAPLTQLLRKGIPDRLPELTTEQAAAFATINGRLISPPVLKLPRLGLPYTLDTDAYDAQIGCTLLQTHEDGTRHPIGYWSRQLAQAERNYSTSETECLAIVWAIQTLRLYLERERFTVYTDHHALPWLLNLSDASGSLARWRLRLAEFDFDVKYVKGIKNSLAGALSRLPTDSGTTVPVDEEIPCFLLREPFNIDALDVGQSTADGTMATGCFAMEPADTSAITPKEMLRAQQEDSYCAGIASHLEKGEAGSEYLRNESGILCRKAHLDGAMQMVVPESLQDRVLYSTHYPAQAGYPGGRRIYYTLRQNYYWPAMAVAAYDTVRRCPDGAKARLKLRRHQTELKLFPATAPLEFVSLDLLGELP